jgi:AmmeMemoRadiSam system protein B
MDYPKLRPVEAIQAQENMICLRDPLGFSNKLVFLQPEAFFIVTMFDGSHSVLDIQAAYTRRFGDMLFSDRIHKLIEQLDSALFLDSDHFKEQSSSMIKEFRASAVRPATHAGVSYEQNADALRRRLDELFEAYDGRNDESTGSKDEKRGSLCGLIAPHIDIRRGGECFALSYGELARESRANTFVVLGISHVPTKRRFVLANKDYDTPLGSVQADRGLIDSLSKRCSFDFFEDEFVHRNEHSVEFQAVFLRYIFRDRPDVRMVPVLCSSLNGTATDTDASPADNPEFRDFSGALRELLAERGEQVCFIAGVDLSHLGRRFGQNLTMSPAVLDKARDDDMEMIEFILDRNEEGFFRFIAAEKDRRNVCGVPALYTLLNLIDARSATLLKYDQSVEDQTQSVVTFMSAAFYR